MILRPVAETIGVRVVEPRARVVRDAVDDFEVQVRMLDAEKKFADLSLLPCKIVGQVSPNSNSNRITKSMLSRVLWRADQPLEQAG